MVACATESTGGRPEEIIELNEEQSMFLMTLLKNTEEKEMIKMKRQKTLKTEARNTALTLIGVCFAIMLLAR